jgi:hypothetical protein
LTGGLRIISAILLPLSHGKRFAQDSGPGSNDRSFL